MSNSFENNRPSNRRPTMLAYAITERTGAKNIWTQIGAAWPNRDGKGFSIKLHAFPIDGKLVLREPLPNEDETSQAALEPRQPIDYGLADATSNFDETF